MMMKASHYQTISCRRFGFCCFSLSPLWLCLLSPFRHVAVLTMNRRHTGYKYGGHKAEVVSVQQMLLTSQRCKTVIVGFRGCERHRS